MKLSFISIAVALLTLAGAAAAPDKQVIITYPNDTPDSVLKQAKDAIRAAGGIITHEYELIRGFAATASARALNVVNALSTDFIATIEEDQVVTVNQRS